MSKSPPISSPSATDAQLRQRLRDFWIDVLGDLETERVEILQHYAAAQDAGQDVIPNLQKDFIDKAAKASDQIRRDFPDLPPEDATTPAGSPPPPTPLSRLGQLTFNTN